MCGVASLSGSTLLMAAWQPSPLPAALAIGLLGALGFARWKAPRSLAGIQAQWVFPASVHALNEVTVGVVLMADKGSPPVTLEAWQPMRRRFEIVSRFAGLGLDPSRAWWIACFPKRGRAFLPALVVETRQPFGLVAARASAGFGFELIVFPALGQIRREFEARIERWLETHSPGADDGDDEFAYLREYRPGDHPRSIHWKASARRGSILVSQRHAVVSRRLSLVVDTTAGTHAWKLERLLSAAATLVDYFFKKGWALTLFGHFAPDGMKAGREELLELLALAEAQSGDISRLIPEETVSVVLTLKPLDVVAPGALVLTLAECEAVVLIPPRVR
ncbi:MAG: hypothetical protein JWL59_3147 [Chthoniobacteraceae bacterium]|nr:hypothetical protein [Chthoniobacteraceae bacterium]